MIHCQVVQDFPDTNQVSLSPIQNFLHFMKNEGSVVLTRTCHWYLAQAILQLYFFRIHFNVITLPFMPSGFQATLYAFLILLIHATHPINLSPSLD
jgi:hypothetical protein